MKHSTISKFTKIFVLFAFLLASVLLRSGIIASGFWINPDEAELIAQGQEAYINPLPFSTWVTTTAGPVWVWFLAGLHFIGFPLTISSAHLLASLLIGFIAFFLWILANRRFGILSATTLVLVWWLPLILVTPLGQDSDFAAMSTELLPLFVITGMALFTEKQLQKSFFVAPSLIGLLAGLAFFAKYQSLPIALALAVLLIWIPGASLLNNFKRLAIAAAAFIFLIFVVILCFFFKEQISWESLQIHINFLRHYSSQLSMETKLGNFLKVFQTNPLVIIWTTVAIFSATLSRGFEQFAKIVLLFAALVSVFLGGMGFGHYLLFVYVAAAVSIFKWGSKNVSPHSSIKRIGVVTTLLLVVSVIIYIPSLTAALTSNPNALISLDVNKRVANQAIHDLCPSGTKVLVWGWAAENYSNYEWRMGIPFPTVGQITQVPENIILSRDLVKEGIEKSGCILDAVGAPFFGIGAEYSIFNAYPDLTDEIQGNFTRVSGLIDCEDCSLWVRNSD